MKIFVEDYSVIIDAWFKSQVENAKHGDLVPHKKEISDIYFYENETIGGQEVYRKIILHKNMILHLAEKIKEIESETVEMPHNGLPF